MDFLNTRTNTTNMEMVKFGTQDTDSTILKCVDVNDNICPPPINKTPKQRYETKIRNKDANQRYETKIRNTDANLSDHSNHSLVESNVPLLPSPRWVPFHNDAVVDSDYLRPLDPPAPETTKQYYNVQNRELPPTPPAAPSDDSGSSSSGSPSCSSCGCAVHSLKQDKLFNKGHYLICITVVSVIFSIVSCSIASLGLVYKRTSSWEGKVFNEGVYETCVPCVQLSDNDGSNTDLESQLTKKFVEGEPICCANTSGQMSALVQLMMNQKTVNVVSAPAQKTFKFTPVSAHKHLRPWSTDEIEEPQFMEKRYHLKLRPNSGDVTAEHVKHVTATNNSLQIQFSGWYLIYSSVYFKPRTDKLCGNLRHQTWGHFISRMSPTRRSTSGTLMQSAHTCCDNCTDDHHTSYTAGVFLLEAGDAVYVEVSGSGLVLFYGEGSYVGLVMLGSWNSPNIQG